ncbi:MAG TPA: M23 family metallopeptidase [Vicinamibacterales bacterium]|nr:M23 family metallopeptidase [Vicinamibacterales bacterium]
MIRRRAIAAGVICGLAFVKLDAQAQIPPSVEFSVPKPPAVALSDSGAFLSYELHVTNLTPAPMTVRRVEVLDATTHAVLLSMSDTALLRAYARVAPPTCRDSTPRPAVECLPAAERAQLPAGVRAYVYVWLPVDKNHPPAKLSHRLTLRRKGADSSDVVLEGTTILVSTDVAAISAPFHGEWAAFNGPSNSSGHRRLVLGLDGHTAIGQRFAIDFLKLDSTGSSHRGDPANNANYYAYGTELLAVADGVIAGVKDGIPQNVPGANSRAVPITMETVGGNYVAIDIGHGRYALYAHVQPGSLRVKVGDHVKRGQVVALLGNSGNSTEPHVHFQVADGPTFLSSEGIPYAMDHFDVVGHCGISVSNGQASISCTRSPPVTVNGGIALQNEIIRVP